MKTPEEIHEAIGIVANTLPVKPPDDPDSVIDMALAVLSTLTWVVDDPAGYALAELLANLKAKMPEPSSTPESE